MSQYSQETLEIMVREGKFSEVKAALQKIAYSKLSRVEILHAANMAYRIHFPRLSLKILGPIIKESDPQFGKPLDLELAEYAIALCRLGATKEAKYWLNQANDQTLAKVLLYHAFICISEWDYAGAIGYLNQYIDHSEVTDYEKLVGKTNLAASFIYEEMFDEADSLLVQIKGEAKKNDHKLLLANSIELSAQTKIFKGEFKEASLLIESGLIVAPNSSAQLFLRKWDIILNALQNPKDVDRLKGFLSEVESANSWESLRQCQFYLAKITQNEDLFLKIYAGTPLNSYRKKLLKNIGFEVEIPKTVIVPMHNDQPGDIFDLQKAEYNNKQIMKPGGLPHQLLQLLCSDLYKPLRLGNIFSQLFPNEHYSVVSTPNRVHQIIIRLRQSLESIPLQILEADGLYSVSATGPVSIRFTTSTGVKNTHEVRLERLREEFPSTPFGIKDVMRLFAVSRTQAHYIIRDAESFGLCKTGKGPSTRYVFQNKTAA